MFEVTFQARPRDNTIQSTVTSKAKNCSRRALTGRYSRGGCKPCRYASYTYRQIHRIISDVFRRIKHKKCGQEKPNCSRCQQLKIPCEGFGYGTLQPPPPRSSAHLQLIRLSSAASAIRKPLQSLSFESTELPIYYDLFCNKTIFEHLPFFDTNPLRRVILQSCSNPLIRHFVTALGALHRAKLASAEEEPALSLSKAQTTDSGTSTHTK